MPSRPSRAFGARSLTKYLLDTNIVSELRKANHGNAGVLAWSRSNDLGDAAISVVTLQEVETGALLVERQDPGQAVAYWLWIEHVLLPSFEGRILEISQAIAIRCASLHVPDKRPYADSLIAATALHHELVVITRNAGHFRPMGVRLLNPWST